MIYQQLHLLKGLLQQKPWFFKLRDSTEPRSTLPLAEQLASPPLGTECAEAAGVTTELRVRFLEAERGL